MPFRCIYDTKYLFCYHLSLLSFHLSILSEEWTWIAVKSQKKKILCCVEAYVYEILFWVALRNYVLWPHVQCRAPVTIGSVQPCGSSHICWKTKNICIFGTLYIMLLRLYYPREYIFSPCYGLIFMQFFTRENDAVTSAWVKKLSFPDLIILLLLCWVINEQMVLYGHVAQSIFRTYRSVR